MIASRFVLFAAINAAIAVMGGAFAAHGLDLSQQDKSFLKTAAEYQLIHSISILVVVTLKGPRVSLYAFSTGIIMFSGSLYGMALATLSISNFVGLEIITTLGGVAFIIGWLALAWSSYRRKT